MMTTLPSPTEAVSAPAMIVSSNINHGHANAEAQAQVGCAVVCGDDENEVVVVPVVVRGVFEIGRSIESEDAFAVYGEPFPVLLVLAFHRPRNVVALFVRCGVRGKGPPVVFFNLRRIPGPSTRGMLTF